MHVNVAAVIDSSRPCPQQRGEDAFDFTHASCSARVTSDACPSQDDDIATHEHSLADARPKGPTARSGYIQSLLLSSGPVSSANLPYCTVRSSILSAEWCIPGAYRSS